MTLADFLPLSRAEQLLLIAYRTGRIARVGYRRPRLPSADVTVRGEFLSFLARGAGDRASASGKRIDVLGAWIAGRFTVQGVTVPVSLWMFRCTFDAAPVLDGARVLGSVSLPGCLLPALHAQGCLIAGSLALNAGCRVPGAVRLSRSTILRDLNVDRGRLGAGFESPPSGQVPLLAEALRVGGSVRLGKGLEAAGEIRLNGARIEGDLIATGARLHGSIGADGERMTALNLDRVQVSGNLLLNGGFAAAGMVRLERARIAGDLDGSDAAFDVVGDSTWSDGGALRLDGAWVGGALRLRRLQTALLGASLVDARVGTLADDATTWGQRHVLDGFRYGRLADGAPTQAAFRRSWLTRQTAAHLNGDFRPDPWRRAIKVLRRMGHDLDADQLAVDREDWLRRADRIGRGTPKALRWLPRLGHAVFGWIAGYGHRPGRLLLGMLVVWLACAVLYHLCGQQGALAPTNPLLYSLERMVPMLDLLQRQPVAAEVPLTASDLPWNTLVRAVTVAQGALGWLATVTLVATLAGWVDRDRRG